MNHTKREFPISPSDVEVKLALDDLQLDEMKIAYRRGYEEAQINNPIFRAAPDLYEALKVAYRELLHAQWQDGLDQIEQALAKAEGK